MTKTAEKKATAPTVTREDSLVISEPTQHQDYIKNETEKQWYSVAEIAAVLCCAPQQLRVLARKDMLPFSHVEIGNRVKFPKESFDRWKRGETA